MKKLLRVLCIVLIRFYQLGISPFLGKSCRFYPSCSEYAHEAFSKLPLHKAFIKTLLRLCKCHPFHKGGIDTLKYD